MVQIKAERVGKATAERAITMKNEALWALTDDMKANLRYAENVVDYDDDPLELIGWSGRGDRTSFGGPGQCCSLEAPGEGEG